MQNLPHNTSYRNLIRLFFNHLLVPLVKAIRAINFLLGPNMVFKVIIFQASTNPILMLTLMH
jgi:hypothetical protein